MTRKAKTAKTARKGKARKTTAQEAKLGKRVIKGTIVPKAFKQAYAAHGGTNGSALALALKEATTRVVDNVAVLDVDALFKIARQNGVDPTPYAALNNGQKRMNVGNKLAAIARDGGTVKIGGKGYGPRHAESQTRQASE